MTQKYGVVMILDEVITGFRWSPGGLQQMLGIEPDLCTMAKILTGGLPGGAVAGREHVMAVMEQTGDAHHDRFERVYHVDFYSVGELKIIFPNQYSVYLHGTPGKHLFDRAERAFSSGCIRLEHPDQMAEWVAGQDSEERAREVKDALSTTTNQRIDFESRLPIHITYMTVTVNDDETVNFWRDIYDRTEGIKQVERSAPLGQTASVNQEQSSTDRG